MCSRSPSWRRERPVEARAMSGALTRADGDDSKGFAPGRSPSRPSWPCVPWCSAAGSPAGAAAARWRPSRPSSRSPSGPPRGARRRHAPRAAGTATDRRCSLLALLASCCSRRPARSRAAMAGLPPRPRRAGDRRGLGPPARPRHRLGRRRLRRGDGRPGDGLLPRDARRRAAAARGRRAARALGRRGARRPRAATRTPTAAREGRPSHRSGRQERSTSGSARRPCWPAPCGRCRPCACRRRPGG